METAEPQISAEKKIIGLFGTIFFPAWPSSHLSALMMELIMGLLAHDLAKRCRMHISPCSFNLILCLLTLLIKQEGKKHDFISGGWAVQFRWTGSGRINCIYCNVHLSIFVFLGFLKCNEKNKCFWRRCILHGPFSSLWSLKGNCLCSNFKIGISGKVLGHT